MVVGDGVIQVVFYQVVGGGGSGGMRLCVRERERERKRDTIIIQAT